MEKKPIIGITMGDPSGNGSEISVKALSDPAVYERCKPIIIGDANCMKNAVEFLGKDNEIRIHAVENVKNVWGSRIPVCCEGDRACNEKRD